MNRTTASFIHQNETVSLVAALSTTSFQRVPFELSAFSILEEEDNAPVPDDLHHESAAKLRVAHPVVLL